MVWLLFVLGFAIWTRDTLRREGLWRDEAISVYVAQAPSLPELLRRNRISDYNPPLFNLVLAGYGRLAGFDEDRLKVFAATIGLLTLAGCAALAYELGGVVAGSVAAAFAVNNPILIGMSAELRAYSLSAFLGVTSLLLIFRIRSRQRPGARFGSFFFLTALLTLLVYSHVAGGIVAAILCGWGALAWRKDPASSFGKGLTLSSLAAGGTFLFWLPTTWRQARVGLPWESAMSPSQKLESLLHRFHDLLPIPGGFNEPFVLLGMAALIAVALLRGPRVFSRMRLWNERVSVPAVVGAGVWLALGLFSRNPRYLMIPATLSAIVAAVLTRAVLDSGLEARPVLRGFAFLGIAALVIGSFSARADLYREFFSAGDRPKSGIRSLCRDHAFESAELVVVAPDYLAPSIWYYCGRREDLHGFVRWDEPELFDPRRYTELWNNPSAPAAAVAKVGEALRESDRSRLDLVFDESWNGRPLQFGERVRKLRAELAQQYDEKVVGEFPGRIESVKAAILTCRGN